MKTTTFRTIFSLILVLLVTLSCNLGSPQPSTPLSEIPAPTFPAPESGTPGAILPAPESEAQPSPDAPAYPPPAEPAQASPAAPVATQAPGEPSTAGGSAPCQEKTCILDGYFLLKRPIGPEGRENVDTASRFGTLRKSLRDAYHGVQFLNSTGTPVLAAAAGDVIVAGDDSQTVYGTRQNQYGNLVIIEHSLPGVDGPVYTLYAHLSEIHVKAEGDVQAGQQIGTVGMTGSALGSTLYFEVRLGENSYSAARNPELWLELLQDDSGQLTGALAGRILDGDGNYVAVPNILVENVRSAGQGIRQLYLKTYVNKKLMGVNPLQESFAAAGLPEGTYQISFYYLNQLYQREVEVQPGLLTWVSFAVK